MSDGGTLPARAGGDDPRTRAGDSSWNRAGVSRVVSAFLMPPLRFFSLFSDLPSIPADVAVKPGYTFKP